MRCKDLRSNTPTGPAHAGRSGWQNSCRANAGPAMPNRITQPQVAAWHAILDTLEAQEAKREGQHVATVRLGLTAVLRSRPEGSDTVTVLFLTNLNNSVRADAANTIARLRTKTANLALRGMLMSDADPVARANAARALGAEISNPYMLERCGAWDEDCGCGFRDQIVATVRTRRGERRLNT